MVMSNSFLLIPRIILLSGALLLTSCASVKLTSVTPPAVNPAPAIKPTPKLGLVLGGGAARGFAHIGVIQVLEENGIKPDLVVGTSAGSLVGSIYATGKGGKELKTLADRMAEASIIDWTLPFLNRGGLLRGDAYAKYVGDQVGHKLIEQASIPLGIVATNLQSGKGILFRQGDIATAVRASSAVPGVFPPVTIGGLDFVDGGLVAPVPVRYARQMGATLVLAVDISSAPEGEATDNLLQILIKTFSIMSQSINSFENKGADVLVRPALVGVSSSDFAAKGRAIEAGRTAMLAELPKLQVLLAQ